MKKAKEILKERKKKTPTLNLKKDSKLNRNFQSHGSTMMLKVGEIHEEIFYLKRDTLFIFIIYLFILFLHHRSEDD